MRGRKRGIVLFCILVLVVSLPVLCGCVSEHHGSTRQISALTFYTEQMPPYNYLENGSLQGITIDLLEKITEKMGDPVSRDRVRLVSWSEGYRTALNGNNTAIFAIARTPERESSFKWAGPIKPYVTVLFSRPGSNIVIDDPGDLADYRIGVIADDAAVGQLVDAGVNESRLVYETNTSVLIAKLRDGEIDLWGYGEAGGRYFTRQATGNYYSFRVVYAFPEIPIYYGFSKDVPDETVLSFQQALDSLKAEKDAAGISAYDRILGRYDPSVGLAQLRYLTEEWAPYNYEEGGNVTGIAVDILGEVFSELGVNRNRADVRIVPLAEGFRETQNTSTVLFSIVRTPEREPLYKWAGPFTKSGFVIYAPVSRNITISGDRDLDRYRIGAVRSSIENDLLAARGVNVSRIVQGSNPEEVLSLLESGQIDLWATGDLAGRHQMLLTARDPNAYEIVATLSENEFYYIFSKDVPDTLVDAIGQGLAAVRNRRGPDGVSAYERIVYRYLGVGCARPTFSDGQVMELVNATAEDIGNDAAGTLKKISAGEAPYRDPVNRDLSLFVYDENETMVAHADNPAIIGMNFRGKTDVTGYPLHDRILAGAIGNGTGWVEFVYWNPVQTNLYRKAVYYRLAKGSDGERYIVCSGTYRSCQ